MRVVVATNAFTSELIPELKAIRPYQSQIMMTEHAPDRARGRVVTSEYGPTFFNQPRDGLSKVTRPLLMGGGADPTHAQSVVGVGARFRSTSGLLNSATVLPGAAWTTTIC